MNSNKLYVGGLPYEVTDDRLQELFSAHGTVESARRVCRRTILGHLDHNRLWVPSTWNQPGAPEIFCRADLLASFSGFHLVQGLSDSQSRFDLVLDLSRDIGVFPEKVLGILPPLP